MTVIEPVHTSGPGIEIAGGTDRGLVRLSNEDSYEMLQSPSRPSWCLAAAAVFDGVGGLSNGKEASSRAARYMLELLNATSPKVPSPEAIGRVVSDLILDLHDRLKADLHHEPALQKMATTATVAVISRGAPAVLWVGHVVDNPVLRLRGGSIEQLVNEDSMVAGLLRDGLINQEQAQRHPQRHVITQALGHGSGVIPHVSAHTIDPGDCYLLCTDGLTTMLPDKRILEIVNGTSPKVAVQRLIESAKAAGGFDNITVVVTRF